MRPTGFPCLHTLAPAPTATSAAAVDTLMLPLLSPPVPQVSMRPRPAASSGTVSEAARIAESRPTSSSAVSPLVRRAITNPAICAGVASPLKISVMAA